MLRAKYLSQSSIAIMCMVICKGWSFRLLHQCRMKVGKGRFKGALFSANNYILPLAERAEQGSTNSWCLNSITNSLVCCKEKIMYLSYSNKCILIEKNFRNHCIYLTQYHTCNKYWQAHNVFVVGHGLISSSIANLYYGTQQDAGHLKCIAIQHYSSTNYSHKITI